MRQTKQLSGLIVSSHKFPQLNATVGARSGLFVFGLLGRAKARNSSGCNASSDRFRSVSNEIENPKFSHEERAYWLSKFGVELRKENGEFYTPNSLMQIACGLQRHFRENGYADLNIFTDA
jgi:hypothetical protein